MYKTNGLILTVFLFMSGCYESRTVTKVANDNGVVLPAGRSIDAVTRENRVLPASFDQDFVCFDPVDVTYFNLTFTSNNTIHENGNYVGSYSTDGSNLDLSFIRDSYYSTYNIVVNDALDFFQARDSNNYLISCITTRHSETDKVVSDVTITCPNHGSFFLNTNGASSATDSFANNYYGTYYANTKTGEFLLHYMGVDNSGNISLSNFPAQVRSMSVIDVVFPDGTEQCVYQ